MQKRISILIGFISLLTGFIPLSINKQHDIEFNIYAKDVVSANKIKGELIAFYKEYCYSPLFCKIDEKIKNNINMFKYTAYYDNNIISVEESKYKIKMTGYLYKVSPSSINLKYYFKSVPLSIPEATSISVATFSVLDHIS